MTAVLPTGLIRTTDAATRLDAEAARVLAAYALGSQAVQWGMQ
jgi:hypothetical protein